MDERIRKELERMAIEMYELSDVMNIMYYGLQSKYSNMENALSCIHYSAKGIMNMKDKIGELVHQDEKE